METKSNSPDSINIIKVVGIGDFFQIPIQKNSAIHIGHKSLLSIKDNGNILIVKGKKIGETFIQLKKMRYRVLIAEKKIAHSYRQLNKWLKNKRGPALEVTPRELSITGRILKLADIIELNKFFNTGSSWSMKAKILPDVQSQLTQYINRNLLLQNLTKGIFHQDPEWTYSIHPDLNKQSSLYKRLLTPLGIQLIHNSNLLIPKQIFQIKILIGQMSQSFFHHFGMGWPGSAQAQVPNPTSSLLLQWGALDFTANFLEERGYGTIVASPMLTTRSGQLANFHSGGEYPVQSQNSLYSQVQWKKHGILLKITPKIEPSGAMEINIETEISLLDFALSSNGIPSLQTSRVATSLYLKKGQPIIISGLLKQSWKNNQSGLPLLQQIPIISSLFSNSQKRMDQSDLVFILIPKVIAQ